MSLSLMVNGCSFHGNRSCVVIKRLQSTEAMTSLFFHFSDLDTMYRSEHDVKHLQPKFGGNRFSWGPEIWLHEYLSSSIEISVN